MMVKLSVGTWAYTLGEYAEKPVSVEEVAVRLGQLGYDGVSLSGAKPHGHYELYPTRVDRRKLVDLFQSNGLEINSYDADLWDYPFAYGDAQMKQKYELAFDRIIEMCVDCSIPVIRVDTVSETPYPADFDYVRVWDATVAAFKTDAVKAGKADLQVVWEFEPGFIFNKPSEIVKMIKDVGEDNFKLQVDTCHVQTCAVLGANQYGEIETLPEGQLEFYKMVGGMIGDVHIIDSDNTLHDDLTSTHSPFGTGLINFMEVVPAIVEAGYRSEWWTVDLCFEPNAWDLTVQSKRYLDDLFKKPD